MYDRANSSPASVGDENATRFVGTDVYPKTARSRATSNNFVAIPSPRCLLCTHIRCTPKLALQVIVGDSDPGPAVVVVVVVVDGDAMI